MAQLRFTTSPRPQCKRPQKGPLTGLTDAGVQFLKNMHTSKSSLKIWNLKCCYTAKFFEANQPFVVEDYYANIPFENEIVNRSLNKSLCADRLILRNGQWLPSPSIIDTFRISFRRAKIPFKEVDNPFGIRTCKLNISLAQSLSTSLLAINPNHTLTQYCVELALWEAHFFNDQRALTLKHLSERLNISKSTLSTALWQLADLQQVVEEDHPDDARTRFWRINASHPAILHRGALLLAYLDQYSLDRT